MLKEPTSRLIKIYRILNDTGKAVITGQTINPTKRLCQYRRKLWWSPEFRMDVYRELLQENTSDHEYGLRAACVEHMEICRNRTWDAQGGKNQFSPIAQYVGGPSFRAQVCSLGGIKAQQMKKGISALTPEQRSENGYKGNRDGKSRGGQLAGHNTYHKTKRKWGCGFCIALNRAEGIEFPA